MYLQHYRLYLQSKTKQRIEQMETIEKTFTHNYKGYEVTENIIWYTDNSQPLETIVRTEINGVQIIRSNFQKLLEVIDTYTGTK